MENLNKTIKKLNEKDYQALIESVAGNRKDKPFQVIESARTKNLSDAEMIVLLEVNPSTYYTLKSRLNTKIAGFLSKVVDNPISALMEKVARVQANLYGTNKTISIKALQDLEKELMEYDLSNELIVVYKTLARLHLHSEEYAHYQQLYNRHVAFSLSVSKAEDLLYEFTKKMSSFLLTRSPEDLESLKMIREEMSNIYELYESHRLFVLFNIVKIYFWCNAPGDMNELKGRELEIDQILQEMNKIFNKFSLDTFYQNIKPLVDFMYFQYYQKTGNAIRADHHYKKINPLIPELCKKHIMSFYMVQFLDAKVGKYIADHNLEGLKDNNGTLKENFDIDKNEIYHYAVMHRFLAITKFYEGDFAGAAKIMNELRSDISLRNYLSFEVECKMFQALQYCMMGDNDLCLQLAVSITRQMDAEDKHYEPVKIFLKLMKASMKTTEFRQKIKKITELWENFKLSDKGNHHWLWYVSLDEAIIRRMSNPLK